MTSDPGSARPATTRCLESFAPPTAAWREAAGGLQANRENHDRLAQASGLFDALRCVQPAAPAVPESTLRVAAWNLERCKHVEPSAALLARVGVDVVLVTEMDLGMARSGNRDTMADLADALGMGHAWGVEFIELGHGDARERLEHGTTPNSGGLHGNGVLTRFPVERAALLPLDAGGDWFAGDTRQDQRRIGGRMAIAVRHLLPDPVWFIAVHYESRLGPEDRGRETLALLSHIDDLCGEEPVLVGGDFNCNALQKAGIEGQEVLARPGDAEAMFVRLADAGFDWSSCNTSDPTTRIHPWMRQDRPTRKIDWFFARGVSCVGPSVAPAVNDEVGNLSDHEVILVEVAP